MNMKGTNLLRRTLFLIIGILMCSSVASALFSCQTNSNPVLENNLLNTKAVDWICTDTLVQNQTCISYVKSNGSLVQINPTYDFDNCNLLSCNNTDNCNNAGCRKMDSFHSQNGITKVYFRNLDLIDNKTVTFGIECSSGAVLETNVTPHYKNFDEIFLNVENVNEHGNMMLYGFLLLLAILVIIMFVVRWVRHASRH